MMHALEISVVMGIVAGLANVFGAAIVSARPWSRTFLAYFIAVGAGFMLATALTEMVPESFKQAPAAAAPLMLAGYFIVHFFEHSWPGHFHFGEETHRAEFFHARVAYVALGGLSIHTFFGGVAIASGYLISPTLGTLIAGAEILHNIPEGFTIASIMVAAGKRPSVGVWSAVALAVSRLAGILVMAWAGSLVSYGLAISAGVTLYVAASDLIPEVNKMPRRRMALAVAAGVLLVLILRRGLFSWLGA
jgi:zinc transporter ZupT